MKKGEIRRNAKFRTKKEDKTSYFYYENVFLILKARKHFPSPAAGRARRLWKIERQKRRIRKKKTLKAALCAALACAMLAGCGSAPSSTAPASGSGSTGGSASTASDAPEYERATVRVAYMPNMGSGSSLITGIEMGYFDEVGLDVELTQFQGGPAEIAAMASGDIDIAQIGHGAHALCIEGQAKIFALDLLGVSDEVLANTERGIETVADLKGKTIASTAGTSAEIVLDLVLGTAGLTTDDVTVVEMDANGCVSAMISGQIDACATWAPSTTTIKEQMGDKCVSLGSNGDFVDTVTFPGSFVATEKYASEHEDILVRFTQALMKAQDYRAANIEQVCEWLAKEIEADPETILATKDSGEWLTGEFLVGALADGTIEQYYDSQQQVFVDSGRIPEKVPVSDYVLFDVMQKAADAYTAAKS